MFLQSDADEGMQPSAGMYWVLAARNVLCGIVKEFSERGYICSQNMFPWWDICQCYNWSSCPGSC